MGSASLVRARLLGIFAGLLAVGLTVLAFCPASWMATALEKQTGGRLTLGDVQGTLWNGSAFIGGAPGPNDPVTPLVPGRFAWHLSPMLLLGQVRLDLQNSEVLNQQVRLSGGLSNWSVSPATMNLTADRLSALGAPLNTMKPTGQMRLSWSELKLARNGQALDVNGHLEMELTDVASRLSPVRPLGAYRLVFEFKGNQATLVVTTIGGPMQIAGQGRIDQGRFQFSGTAQAEAGQEEKLANLLNLLGQRRREGDKDVIALEFK